MQSKADQPVTILIIIKCPFNEERSSSIHELDQSPSLPGKSDRSQESHWLKRSHVVCADRSVYTCIHVHTCICKLKHFLGLRISLGTLSPGSAEEAAADNAIHRVPWKSRQWKERLERLAGARERRRPLKNRVVGRGREQGGLGGDSLTQGKEVAHRHAVCHLRATASSNDRSAALLLPGVERNIAWKIARDSREGKSRWKKEISSPSGNARRMSCGRGAGGNVSCVFTGHAVSSWFRVNRRSEPCLVVSFRND